MEFPELLSRQLGDLTDALDDSGTDLQAILAVLVDDLTQAIPSFLGLTITVRLADEPVTLAVFEPADLAAARSSLQVPLAPGAGAGAGARGARGSVVVFYAAGVGVFAELAADIRRLAGFDGQVVLDAQLPDTDGTHGPGAVTDPGQAALIHRAIGWLIGQGWTPEAAAQELRRRATATGRSLAGAAYDLLERGADDDHPDAAV